MIEAYHGIFLRTSDLSMDIDTDNGRSGLNINIISLFLIHYAL